MRMTSTYLGVHVWEATGRDAHHWRCTLHHEGRTLTVPFHKGMGLDAAAPTADEVLSALVDDAASALEARDFHDWCAHYGYDPTDRPTEQEWQTLLTQARRVRVLLGDNYDALREGRTPIW